MTDFLINYYGLGFRALQIVVAIIFVVHGWPKIKDPKGIAGAVWGGRTWAGVLQGIVEVVGGLAIFFGFWMEWALFVLVAIMIGAIFFKIVKWKVPFTAQSATGWEFDLLLLAALLALLFG
ncbi:MAG TPA: DoxX family protein [Candidatus Paceibacterota bacterium]|nr:DoxX family protein [Candidatus Paceibacterota bacterium]